jgi:hypothetical protein
MMDPGMVANMQQRIIASISRSAVMVLSTSLNRRLNPFFSASELILVLLVLHTLLNTTRTVPGFNASWRTLRDLMQFLVVQALATYVSSSSEPGAYGLPGHTTVLNLILVLAAVECVPAAKGWVGDDLESFTTSVSFIFSDRISAILTGLRIPLFGATLALCLGGKGLLGRTLAFVGINTLSALAFEAISGGELSLAWPITLLYFVHGINARYDVDAFFNFGLYRASDAVYASLAARGLSPATVFMAFLFLTSLFPSDPVWTAVCALVFVQGGSNWFLGQLGVISATDPVLAGLCLVTAVHFISIAVESSRPKTYSNQTDPEGFK